MNSAVPRSSVALHVELGQWQKVAVTCPSSFMFPQCSAHRSPVLRVTLPSVLDAQRKD